MNIFQRKFLNLRCIFFIFLKSIHLQMWHTSTVTRYFLRTVFSRMFRRSRGRFHVSEMCSTRRCSKSALFRRVAKMYTYSLTETNGNSASSGELCMSDVMNDRALRSVSGRIPGPGLSGRDIGDHGVVRAERALSERCVRAYTRDQDATVPLSEVIYEARGLVPATRTLSSRPRGYVRTDTTTIVSGDVRFALATPSAIIHVACCNRYRDLHQQKSPGGSRLLALSHTGIFRLPNERVENVQLE